MHLVNITIQCKTAWIAKLGVYQFLVIAESSMHAYEQLSDRVPEGWTEGAVTRAMGEGYSKFRLNLTVDSRQ